MTDHQHDSAPGTAAGSADSTTRFFDWVRGLGITRTDDRWLAGVCGAGTRGVEVEVDDADQLDLGVGGDGGEPGPPHPAGADLQDAQGAHACAPSRSAAGALAAGSVTAGSAAAGAAVSGSASSNGPR